MTLILLEALGALLVLLLIVWWTMFSGRQRGELPDPDATPDAADADAPAIPAAAPDKQAPKVPPKG
ncbi:MAG: hypothetical protein ACKVOO_05815 [Burkholderiaceae bacterium]